MLSDLMVHNKHQNMPAGLRAAELKAIVSCIQVADILRMNP
jgi:hypothetical protein